MSLSTSDIYKIQCNDHQTLTLTVVTIEDHVNDLYTNQLLDFYICNDDFIMLSSFSYSQSPNIANDEATTAFLQSTLHRYEQPFYIKVLLETNVVVDLISTTESHVVEEEQQTQHNIITVAYLLQSNPKQQLMC